mmetsp:Transcript_21357/g.39249  ORF Transcript_21357/g.39249 Transcript_21357/m.39249 type:complete len:317 (+) Transcript_21357:2-952(+)
MYPVLHHDNGDEGKVAQVVDARMLQRDADEGNNGSAANDDGNNNNDNAPPNLYETGALYQGYGTHYLDLWVGSPTPQRQTVIIDTGSSITAFPCMGCQNCGSNPATGERYHLDDDFDVELSGTYEEKQCARGVSGERNVECDLGTFTRDVAAQQEQQQHCQLAVSYAEGSSWSALEGSDIVYPAGPHDVALESRQERREAGVGVGMGSLGGGLVEGKGAQKELFDWMDFRLRFGCQRKVTGLFQTQLEDGIMGMDNRKGAFWLQLHEHYKRNGYHAVPPEENEKQPGDNTNDNVVFDPTQFSSRWRGMIINPSPST